MYAIVWVPQFNLSLVEGGCFTRREMEKGLGCEEGRMVEME